jgi:hypothetical protein
MSDKKRHAAQMLIRHTFMNTHEAFRTTDCEIGQIDWDKILDGDYTREQFILVSVLEFLLEGDSDLLIKELLELNEDDRQAVILALNERFRLTPLEENL